MEERQILKIGIRTENGIQDIESAKGKSILQILQESGMYVSAPCAGNGTCGKCTVRILEGELPVNLVDKEYLDPVELEEGIRLACRAYPDSDLVIELPVMREEDMAVLGVKPHLRGRSEDVQIKENCVEQKTGRRIIEPTVTKEKKYFIAIDIGTTTIAMALAEEETGNIIDTYTALNHQRMYGADVISRIAAANEGKLAELKRLIEEDLWKGIKSLAGESIKIRTGNITDNVAEKTGQNIWGQEGEERKKEKKTERTAENLSKQKTETLGKHKKENLFGTDELYISKIIAVGNTTMIHLLMGYSCETLGRYPFISEHLGKIETRLDECISKSRGICLENIPVIILPGISAFIGSDIAADLLVCDGFEKEGISLLLDLGTNGEMVLGNKDRLVAASAAAGPAFEGGNMVCGTGSISGAISKVRIRNRRAVIGTIAGVNPPVGICGTGIISAIAQLKQNRLMDKQGVLQYPYCEKGYPLWKDEKGNQIAVYQQDIRQFQLAKAAIRVGMEQMMKTFGCQPEDIERVYLAGGFGTQLSIEDAIITGILPAEFRGKVHSVGNGALQGAIMYGMPDRCQMRVSENAESISLAETEGFSEKYLSFLEFED